MLENRQDTSHVIITDLDGTVVDSPKQKVPSDTLINAVNSIRDSYYICAATGRPWSFAKVVIQGLELEDPCIIAGGTQICDPKTGEILWQKTIPQDSLKQVLAVMQKYPDFNIIYNDYQEDEYLYGGTSPKHFTIPTEAVYFIEQIFVPNTLAFEIEEQLKRISHVMCTMVNAQKEGYKDLHVTHVQATKEHAVSELLQMIEVDKKNSIGIGDGHNDLHLFAAVGYKVAMGNAATELKKKADKVIGSVKEDGLAAYLVSLESHT